VHNPMACRTGLLLLLPAASGLMHVSTLRPQLAVSAASRPAPLPLVRLSRPRFARIVMDADSNSYRALGIDEDATYDQIMDAFMELSETYASDPARVAELEKAKEAILDERLKARMAGTLRPAVADSPWDEKPVERIMPWVPVWEFLCKLIAVPTPKYALNVVGLIGGLALATWISPNACGTILLINVMSAMGFMYNRGEAEVVRDDMGQIGEIRPMKPKPMALTCGITFVFWMWGFLKAKKMVAAGLQLPETILRTNLISLGMILIALFVKPNAVFD